MIKYKNIHIHPALKGLCVVNVRMWNVECTAGGCKCKVPSCSKPQTAVGKSGGCLELRFGFGVF
jgi:hypothetical protein